MKSLPTMACAIVLSIAAGLGGTPGISRAEAFDTRLLPARAPFPPSSPGLPQARAQASLETTGRILRVGPSAAFTAPSAAASVARDGDTIEIASGDYSGDVAVWNASRIRIVGAEPRPHIRADGRDAQGKAIWVVRGDSVTIENVEMSGARVADRNGAAIRVEGRNFYLRNAYLHDNENGLLSGANPTSEIVIEHCEFARNGEGEGHTHNLYVGAIAKLTVKQSYLHHAIVGHNLKSRAAISILTDNRLADESDGRASYTADFPNGGQVVLAFNIFQKGPLSENGTLVSYGEEGLSEAKGGFVAKGNTFISQRANAARFIFLAPGTKAININGNIFAGPATLPDVPGVRTNNAVQSEMPGNVDLKPAGFK